MGRSGGGRREEEGERGITRRQQTVAWRVWMGGSESSHFLLPFPLRALSVSTHRAVQTQCDQHEEEDDGEEGGCWHVGYGLRVCDKEEAGA